MSIVLITGCSSGFGLASALAFARAGDTVYASMRDPARGGALREAAQREALDISVVALDVTHPAAIAPCVNEIIKETGRLDVLVNNAGVLRPGAFEDLSDETLREVIDTNFFGPMRLTRAVLPQMRAQRGGYIIMISSLSGIAGLPGDVAYTASKFAIEGCDGGPAARGRSLGHQTRAGRRRALRDTDIFSKPVRRHGATRELSGGLAVPPADRAQPA